MKRLVLILTLVYEIVTAGCAYHLGSPDRSLPGGYHQLTIPMFKNLTQETGIEVSFTNALVQEFERSRTAKVVDPAQAEVEVLGVISDLQYLSNGLTVAGSGVSLPTGTVLTTEYDIRLTVKIVLRRISDRSVIWQGTFNGDRTYQAPQVNQVGLNTVDPLYNLSARRQNIDVIASDKMQEAHNRMTENF